MLADLLKSFFLLDINSVSSAMRKYTQSVGAAAERAAAQHDSSTSSPSASCSTRDVSSRWVAAATKTLQRRHDALHAAVAAIPKRQVVLTANPLGLAGARYFILFSSRMLALSFCGSYNRHCQY
jgi:hypothetical protein